MRTSALPPYTATLQRHQRHQRISRSTFCFRLLHGGNIAAFLVQLAIGFNYDNIIASVIVFSSASLMLSYLQFTNSFQERMISSFLLLGYCITSHFGALLAQSGSLTPLIEGLRVPILTFSHLAGLQIVAILAHWVFRKVKAFHGASESIGRHLLKPMGLFTVPSAGQLWALGLIGFAAQMTGVSAGGDVGGKAIDGIRFMAWAPFLIPVFASRYGDSYCNKRQQFPFIGVFVLGVALLGMALNARGMMFWGPFTGALIFAAFVLRDQLPLQKGAYRRFLISLAIGAVGIQAANYVVVAMVSIRGERYHSTGLEMIQKSFSILSDPSRVEKEASAFDYDAALGLFDEKYIASPMLARFVGTKFHDNSFFFGSSLTDSGADALIDITENQVIAILPEPVIKWLKLNADKYNTFFSGGDTLTFLSAGIPTGGFKTGSYLAQGISIFGYYFYPIFFVICMTIFTMYESLSRPAIKGLPEVSTFALLTIPVIFLQGLTYENLAAMLGIIRVLPQSIVIFAITFGLVRMFSVPYRSD